MAETGWPLIPREVLPAPVPPAPAPPAARGRRAPRAAQSAAGRQLSIFGAETTEPSPLDLAGLVAGPGRLDRMGGTARVAVTVDAAWRVHVLVAELVSRGLVVHWRPLHTHPRTTPQTTPHEVRRGQSPPEPGDHPHTGGDGVHPAPRSGPVAPLRRPARSDDAHEPPGHPGDDDESMDPGFVFDGVSVIGARVPADPELADPDDADPTDVDPAADPDPGLDADFAPDSASDAEHADAEFADAEPADAGPDDPVATDGGTVPGGRAGHEPGDAPAEVPPGGADDAPPVPPGPPRVVFEVRTAYSSRLNGLAHTWPAAAGRLFLSGPRLRLWVAATGRPVDGGYALGVGEPDPATWPAVAAALRRAGLDGVLSDQGLDYLIMGRKRLARLAELVGERPESASAELWPGGPAA